MVNRCRLTNDSDDLRLVTGGGLALAVGGAGASFFGGAGSSTTESSVVLPATSLVGESGFEGVVDLLELDSGRGDQLRASDTQVYLVFLDVISLCLGVVAWRCETVTLTAGPSLSVHSADHAVGHQTGPQRTC